ncbi:MAG TPA: hypothetical protein PKY88_10665 [Anaerohalosphaeraceae bacterium]|nr:hypothetical protein [Anaerohalosphaeraceae bacterium]
MENRRAGWGMILGLRVLTALGWGAIDGKELTIGDWQQQGGPPFFYAKLDAAGYSDWIWYGRSPVHDYTFHEVLSGEWAAAAGICC